MTGVRHGWRRVGIADLCSTIVDCVNRTAPSVPEATPYKMIRTTNIKKGWIDLREVKYVSEETYLRWTRRQMPRRGDVVLTREAPLGEVGMIRTEDQVFLGQRLVAYRANPARLDPRFLLYAFQAPDLQAQVAAFGSGSTVEHMRVPDAKRLEVLLPPLVMQRRIASILSAYDDLIENNTRRIAILEEMARRLYEEWFVHFRFPGQERVPLVESALGRVPKGWNVVCVSELAALGGRSISPSSFPEEVFSHFSIPAYDEGQLPALEPGAAILSNKFTFNPPVVLVSKLNPRFPRIWLVQEQRGGRCISSTEFLPLVPSPGVDAAFFAAVCWSRDFRDRLRGLAQGTSTSHQRAKPADVLGIQVVLPPKEVRDEVGPQLVSLYALAHSLRLANVVLRDSRDLLLPKLISGEIDLSAAPTPEEAARRAEAA